MAEDVGVAELKNKLSELLEQVRSNGKEFEITRRGEVIARLVPAQAGQHRAQRAEAVAGFLKARDQVTLGEGVTVRELMNEGRR